MFRGSRKKTGVFLGHEPCRGSGQEVLEILWVGSPCIDPTSKKSPDPLTSLINKGCLWPAGRPAGVTVIEKMGGSEIKRVSRVL